MTENNNNRELNPPTEYDSPWKDILQIYFPEFMQFFFPAAYDEINWEKGIEFLDKELQEAVKDAEIGRRFADKLVKLYLKNGQEKWVLIHLEVQAQEESDFPSRMFTYNYRIYDTYKKPVASLAILGDEKPNWRPSQFRYSLFGCSLNFQFPIVKLVDYQQRLSELENEVNPFATIVIAHLTALNTQRDRNERKVQKLALVRRLYKQGLEQQDVLNLLAFIDWMLTLPPDLEEQFKLEVQQMEAGQSMKYVTSFERSGIELGKQQEAVLLITRQLNRRFGNINDTFLERVRSLPVEKLEQLSDALLDFTSVTDFINWLSQA
ncbi:Rpn family recombination-promoting nuclease/putative transposase [Scytonema sp. NUACC26]|uniref:Rpn family recombination-promoting nuclease/putative transposase n=1 Tax=Scytonema sp. NUACC26 TaxID=3140176 RepID=UPI0038B39537